MYGHIKLGLFKFITVRVIYLTRYFKKQRNKEYFNTLLIPNYTILVRIFSVFLPTMSVYKQIINFIRRLHKIDMRATGCQPLA